MRQEIESLLADIQGDIAYQEEVEAQYKASHDLDTAVRAGVRLRVLKPIAARLTALLEADNG